VMQNKAHPNAQKRMTNRHNPTPQIAIDKRLPTRRPLLRPLLIAQNPKFNYFSPKTSANAQ
jgi:hypothetical protein